MSEHKIAAPESASSRLRPPYKSVLDLIGQTPVVAIASVAGIRGLPGSGAYSASKAAAIAWMEALHVELHGTAVRVVTICPGYIDTPMTQVNDYTMPFLLPADRAATRIARAIDCDRSLVIVPWQMRVVFSVLRLLPAWAYDAIFSRAPLWPQDATTRSPTFRSVTPAPTLSTTPAISAAGENGNGGLI